MLELYYNLAISFEEIDDYKRAVAVGGKMYSTGIRHTLSKKTSIRSPLSYTEIKKQVTSISFYYSLTISSNSFIKIPINFLLLIFLINSISLFSLLFSSPYISLGSDIFR